MPDYFTVSNARRFYLSIKGQLLGKKGLTQGILYVCSSLFLNPFPPRLAKTNPMIILLGLMPDYFTLSNTRCFYLLRESFWMEMSYSNWALSAHLSKPVSCLASQNQPLYYFTLFNATSRLFYSV